MMVFYGISWSSWGYNGLFITSVPSVPYTIELDDGKIETGKPDQFDGKIPMVSCKFSLKPIHQLQSYTSAWSPQFANCESRCTCGMAIWSLNLCLLTLNEDICSWDGEDVVLTSRLRHIYWFDKVRLHMQTSRCVFVKFKYTKIRNSTHKPHLNLPRTQQPL